MRLPSFAVPVVFAVVLVLPVTAMAADPAARASATARVQVGDFFFRPAYLRVEPGDTVVWRVLEGSPHTVTSRPGAPVRFDSGELLPGQELPLAFATAGRYPYLCDLHPFMRGVVQVGPDTVDPTFSKVKARPGKRSVWLSFRLSEASRVSASLASVKKPAKALRRARGRTVQDGRHGLSINTRELKPGRYRATLVAKDPAGNVARAKIAFKLPG
jgi:plastocyanin